jgi:CRP-like cAMP-binding protein
MNTGENDGARLLHTVIFLKKTALFAGMHTADLRAIAAIAEDLRVEAGERIVTENDIGDAMYVIKRGQVDVVKSAATHLASLGPGDCFGDMSVFDAELRSASVIAQSPCLVLRIGGDDILDVIQEAPSIAVGFLKMFIQRLRAANARIAPAASRETA